MPAPDHEIREDEANADVRAVEAILRRWDPIGVAPGRRAPASEYDGYAPDLVSRVRGGATRDEIASHLERLVEEVMGLGPRTAQSGERSSRFAVQIVEAVRSFTARSSQMRDGEER